MSTELELERVKGGQTQPIPLYLCSHVGLKKIILKVRVENPRAAPRPPHPGLSEQPADIIQPNGMPSPAIMDHLLDLFDIHFACQFPALRVDELRAEAMRGGGSIFLLNCIACSAARWVPLGPTSVQATG